MTVLSTTHHSQQPQSPMNVYLIQSLKFVKDKYVEGLIRVTSIFQEIPVACTYCVQNMKRV